MTIPPNLRNIADEGAQAAADLAAASVERIYTEVAGTNCWVGGEHGTVTEVVRDLGLRRTVRAAFVHLDKGGMLYVTLRRAHGDRGQWHEVASARLIDRDEFDRLTRIDTLRHDLGWRS